MIFETFTIYLTIIVILLFFGGFLIYALILTKREFGGAGFLVLIAFILGVLVLAMIDPLRINV